MVLSVVVSAELAASSSRVQARASMRVNGAWARKGDTISPVSYTHLRAHETVLDLVCRLLLEKKNKKKARKRMHQEHIGK